MQLSLVNASVACSSLIIGLFDDFTDEQKKDSARPFAKKLLTAIDLFNRIAKDSARGHACYTVADHAFIVCSTGEYQTWIENILPDFGFTPSRRVSKKKNKKVDCIFWVAPVADVLARLEKYSG